MGCVWRANRNIIYVAISILAIIMNANAGFLILLHSYVQYAHNVVFHVPSSCVWVSECVRSVPKAVGTRLYRLQSTHAHTTCALCTFPTINSFTQSYDLYFIIHVCTLVLATLSLSLSASPAFFLI